MITRLFLLVLLASPTALASNSTCYGTTRNGRLENGVKLPTAGTNFSTYSAVGSALGRTYVHDKVRDVVIAAYRALEKSAAGKVFVYGETGWAGGGRIRPHRTHQNGLSVDFMVPVVDASGKSVPLPTGLLNKFGYDIEFDTAGTYENYTIDFDAMAEQLYRLHVATSAAGVGIALVIFDPALRAKLFQTRRGPTLRKHLGFMKGQAWVRHDDHYHVDFSVRCKHL